MNWSFFKDILVWFWEIGYFRPFSFYLLALLAPQSCLTQSRTHGRRSKGSVSFKDGTTTAFPSYFRDKTSPDLKYFTRTIRSIWMTQSRNKWSNICRLMRVLNEDPWQKGHPTYTQISQHLRRHDSLSHGGRSHLEPSGVSIRYLYLIEKPQKHILGRWRMTLYCILPLHEQES